MDGDLVSIRQRQSMQYPQTTTLPPAVLRDSPLTSPSIGGMVPLNPATSQGIYPSSGPNSPYFDPYNTRPSYQVPLPSTTGPAYPPAYGSVAPYTGQPLPTTAPTGMFGNPAGGYSAAPFNPNGPLPPRLCHPRWYGFRGVYPNGLSGIPGCRRERSIWQLSRHSSGNYPRAPIRILRRLRCFQPASLATTQVACSAA